MKQSKQSDKNGTNAENDVISDSILQRLEKLISIAEKADLAAVRIREGEIEIEISRTNTLPISTSPVEINSTETEQVTEIQTGEAIIRALMPARFYRAPAPDEPPFVQVGDSVTAGSSLATLEVMKTFNDVEAPYDCEILEILVEDGQAVEYNQPLFKVRQN